MRLLMAADMEGISGVVDWAHVTQTHVEYQRFRKIMTADINAAIRGALMAGAEDIIVSDGHGGAKNILIEELDIHARINSGAPSNFSMINGVEGGIDAVAFIGYHARAGTRNAILAHTWSKSTVFNLWLNERGTGEIGFNASLCGHFNVPVIFLSGDQAACIEAREWIDGIETVEVKRAGGFQTAGCLPPQIAQENICAGMEAAVTKYREGRGPKPLKLDNQIKVGLELMQPVMADVASFIPGVNRLDGRTLEFVAPDMPSAQHTFRAVVELAASTL